jgi:hypothetical protein
MNSCRYRIHVYPHLYDIENPVLLREKPQKSMCSKKLNSRRITSVPVKRKCANLIGFC